MPGEHPFENARDASRSSATGLFESARVLALYWQKGATGNGFKQESGLDLCRWLWK
jgi:hypothetical protein